MAKMALVSVAVRTHNRSEYLRQAVQSILDQTFQDYEIVICDDASTDDTPTVCRDLEQLDRRIRTLRQSNNVGILGSWQAGLAASRGRYFVILDDDNCFLPTFLEKAVAALQATPIAVYVFTDEWFVNAERNRNVQVTEAASKQYGRTGLMPGLHEDSSFIALRQSPGINSSLFDRQKLVDAGGFRTLGGELADFDVFLNLAYLKKSCYYIPERLLEYRIHAGANTATLADRTDQAKTSIAILQSLSFEGQAEHYRRRRLAGNHVWLSRALALHGDFGAARKEVKKARLLTPKDLRTLLISTLLALPMSVLCQVLRMRYGKRFQKPPASNAPLKDA